MSHASLTHAHCALVIYYCHNWLFIIVITGCRLCDAFAIRAKRKEAFIQKKSTDSATVLHWGHYDRDALLCQCICTLAYKRKEEAMKALTNATSVAQRDKVRKELGWKKSDTLNIRLQQFGFDLLKDVPPDAMHLMVYMFALDI